MVDRNNRVETCSYTDEDLRQLTGLTRPVFDRLSSELVDTWRVHHDASVDKRRKSARSNRRGGGRPGLKFSSQLLIALTFLRHGRPFRALAAQFGVGKDVAWRAATEIGFVLSKIGITRPGGRVIESVEALEAELAEMAKREDESDPESSNEVIVIDGSFTEVRRPADWSDQKDVYNAHRHEHCMTFQAGVDQRGELLWVGGVSPGSTPDLSALAASPLASILQRTKVPVVVDKGYQGIRQRLELGDDHWIVMPTKKPRGGSLTANQLELNKAISQARICVEHCNARLKRWNVLRYFRRATARFEETLLSVASVATFSLRA